MYKKKKKIIIYDVYYVLMIFFEIDTVRTVNATCILFRALLCSFKTFFTRLIGIYTYKFYFNFLIEFRYAMAIKSFVVRTKWFPNNYEKIGIALSRSISIFVKLQNKKKKTRKCRTDNRFPI